MFIKRFSDFKRFSSLVMDIDIIGVMDGLLSLVFDNPMLLLWCCY